MTRLGGLRPGDCKGRGATTARVGTGHARLPGTPLNGSRLCLAISAWRYSRLCLATGGHQKRKNIENGRTCSCRRLDLQKSLAARKENGRILRGAPCRSVKGFCAELSKGCLLFATRRAGKVPGTPIRALSSNL